LSILFSYELPESLAVDAYAVIFVPPDLLPEAGDLDPCGGIPQVVQLNPLFYISHNPFSLWRAERLDGAPKVLLSSR
jgi:hypothetical protein